MLDQSDIPKARPVGTQIGSWEDWASYVLKTIESQQAEIQAQRQKLVTFELELLQSRLKWRIVWVIGAVLVQIVVTAISGMYFK